MSEQRPKSRLEESIGDARANQSSYSEEEWRQRLGAFLRANGEEGLIGELKRPAGGASAASMIFSLEPAAQGATARRYVARLQSSLFAAFDTVEQFIVQQSLHKAGLPVPAPLWLDAKGTYLGRPGYVMEFATGVSSPPTYFTTGPLSGISTEQRFRMTRNMIGALAEFHNKADPTLACYAGKGRGASWIARELNMWTDLVKEGRPELGPLYEPVAHWLIENSPDVPSPVVEHGDWQGSNVLWIRENISAILDFESVRLGPREHDLVYQYGMDELSARFFDGLDIELPSVAERAAWYEEAAGVKLTNLDYHLTRAVFQLACSAANLARGAKQDLSREPTPIMNHLNRRVLALLPESLPFEPKLPVIPQ